MKRSLQEYTIKSCPAAQIRLGDTVLVLLPPNNMLCIADVRDVVQESGLRGPTVEIGYRYRNGRDGRSCLSPNTEVPILE